MEKKNSVTWNELEEGEIYYIKRKVKDRTVFYIAQYIGNDQDGNALKIFKCLSKSENSHLMLDNNGNFPISRGTVESVCTIYKL